MGAVHFFRARFSSEEEGADTEEDIPHPQSQVSGRRRDGH